MDVIYKFKCGYCSKEIDTIWNDNEDGTTNGVKSSPDHVLFGELFFHNNCLDELLEKYPP